MEAQEYIKNKINDLIQLFPEMKFTYKHDIESEIHEIIAIPESEYNKESFEIEEIKLYDEFADKFPFEGIVINTPDEAIIDDAYYIYETTGLNYVETNTQLTTNASLNIFISFNICYEENLLFSECLTSKETNRKAEQQPIEDYNYAMAS